MTDDRAAYIKKIVDAMPPLTEEQVARIKAIVQTVQNNRTTKPS